MASKIKPISERVQDAYVVDSDFHFEPDGEDVKRYVDDERVLEKMNASSPPNTGDGYPPSAVTWHPGYSTAEAGSGLDAQGRAMTGEDVKQAMDEFGVDMPLLTPGLNHLPTNQYPRIKNEICSAYNDYVLDQVTTVDKNIKMQAAIPQWDPEAAVEELDRIGDEKDVAGVYGWHGPYELLGKPKYDPVFEKLEELGLPWALHGSGFTPRYTLNGDSLRSWVEAIGLTWPVNAMFQVTNMITTGVFDKYPDFNMVIQEGGLNWIPFLAYRLDEFYHDHPEDVKLGERMFDRDQEYLERDPSEYLYDNFYFATQPISKPPNSRHFESMLEMSKAEKTYVFSTDWPHHTVDVPNWLFESTVIDEDLRNSILHENAEEVFRI